MLDYVQGVYTVHDILIAGRRASQKISDDHVLGLRQIRSLRTVHLPGHRDMPLTSRLVSKMGMTMRKMIQRM